MRTLHSVSERAAAQQRLEAGESVRQVAAALGVPRSTVADWKRSFAEAAKTGVMVGFFLPDDAARQLALPADQVDGAEPPGELHLTLAFLGDSGGISDKGRLSRVVAGFAAIAPPLEGQVSGVGMFPGKQTCIYASVDAPQLPEWRQRLVQHLCMAGYAPDSTHGFTPHITLAYVTEKVLLDVPQVSLSFGALTLAWAGERFSWPLEGSAALFAETPSPGPGIPSDNSSANVAPSPEGPQTPADVLYMPQPAPPIMDRLHLEAWQRYFNLLINDVPHHRAVDAAKEIDPDFAISDDTARRAIHALGKGDQPVLFANWSAGNVLPPDYVQSVYEQYRWTADQVAGLADELYALGEESYLDGINAQLMKLGIPIATGIEDPGAQAQVRAEANRVGAGIADTFDKDLGNEVYTLWAELSAERGTQMSRYWLEQAVETWALQRADWKAGQVALTEVGRFYNLGGREFVNRNVDLGLLSVTEAWVTPDVCECIKCLDIVGGNPYPPDSPDLLEIPVHPSCLLPETEVEAVGGLLGASEAPYRGELVRLRTASGQRVTLTPNHPVLTKRGWLPAKLVREGDYALRVTSRDGAVAASGVQLDQVPVVQQVFKALRAAHMPVVRRVVAAHDFHGDGQAMEGEIEVVRAVRGLLGVAGAQGVEVGRQGVLQVAGVKAEPLTVLGPPAQGLGSLMLPPPGGMRRFHHGHVAVAAAELDAGSYEAIANRLRRRPDLLTDLLSAQPAGIERHQVVSVELQAAAVVGGAPGAAHVGLRVGRNAGPLQEVAGLPPREPELSRDFAERTPLLVAPDEVVEVRRIGGFAGHVYDLQTSAAMYVAGHILVHNCVHLVDYITRAVDPNSPEDLWWAQQGGE